MASELHPIKNDFKADEVVHSSHRKAWWVCGKGHEWQSTVSSRSVIGNGCVYCGNRKILVGFNDLKTTHPKLCDEWDYKANGEMLPENFHSGSDKKAIWICKQGHQWETKISNRGAGRGCRICAKFGFDDSKRSQLYFIYNKGLDAYKVGITNVGTRRVKRFENMGWTLIHAVEHENGKTIRDLETLMFRWIRKELLLPIFLTKKDMGNNGGWIETFKASDVKEKRVVEKIRSLHKSMK